MAVEMAFTITAPANLEALLKKLKESDKLQKMQRAARSFAPRLTSALQQTAQGLAGSGAFARGWLAKPAENGLLVTNNAPAARFIEERTRPHVILPVRGNFLAWIPGRGPFSAFRVNASTKAGAGWVFAKKVNHPGTPGKYVFPKVVEAVSDELFDALAQEATGYLTEDQNGQ